MYHQLLSLLKAPQEGCECSNIHCVRQDGHEMIEDAGDLAEECSDPFRPLWHLDIQQLLHSQAEALLIGHHAHVVQPVEVR